MPIGMVFWVLMLFWLIFGIWNSWPNRYATGGNLLLFILLFLLGWHDFGFIIH